jgi:hypothetical protein
MNSDTFNASAVVDCGIIVITQGTYDDKDVQVTAPVFAVGYHYDLMTKR